MKKKNEIKITKIKIDIKWIIIILIIAFLLNFYLRTKYYTKFKPIEFMNQSLCPIYYSDIKCVNNEPSITFENPSNTTIKNIIIQIPTKKGKDVYNVNEPIYQREMKSLIFNYTKCGSIKISEIKLMWCCGNTSSCYQTYLKSPKKLENIIGEYSNISICSNLPTVRKLFCYADIAEITNNISICKLINDNDISSLCFAQLTLNISKCNLIRDNKLRKSCVESVNAKIRWENK